MEVIEPSLSEIVSKTVTDNNKVYIIKTNNKILYYDKSEGVGKMNCYDSSDKFVAACEIIKIKNELEYYIMEDDKPITVGMKCLLIMKYNDLSLINPTDVDGGTKTVTWSKMSKIFPEIEAKEPSNGLSMGCVSSIGGGITGDNTITIDSIKIENGDIVFTLASNPSGKCVLLAKIEGSKIVALGSNDVPDYTKSITKITTAPVTSNMYGVGENNNKIYTIPVGDINNKYDKNSFGLLNCRIPGSKSIKTAYLLGSKVDASSNPNNYYILYDFEFVDIEGNPIEPDPKPIPILYYCELTPYSDFSLYFPVVVPVSGGKCDSVSNCRITWNGMCDIFTTYLPTTTPLPVKFACRTKETNIVELYDYEIPNSCTDNVIFTAKNLDENNLPTDRICNIIGGKDLVNNKIVSIDISESELYKNHLTKKESTKEYKYYTSLPTGTKTPDSSSSMYKVNGLNIISGSTGGIMKCYTYESGKITLIDKEINILYKNGNDYYIHSEIDITGKDCELLYSHKDMTLYPNTIVESNTIKFEKMSYYFQLLGFFKSIQDKYTMLCGIVPTGDATSSFTEYEFTMNEVKNPYYESNSADVVFTTINGVSITNSFVCYLLCSFDGKKVEVNKSDLNNKYTIKSTGSKQWKLSLKESTTPTEPKQNGEITSGIYKVTGVKYEGIDEDKAGGLLECKNKMNNKPLGLAKIYSHYKDGDVDTYAIKYYFVEIGVNPTPEYYDCKVIESYNDLTLYYGIQKYGNGVGVKWTGITIDGLKSMAITIPTDSYKVNMLCETETDNKYKLLQATAENDDSSKFIKFTIDSPPNDKKCFLMSFSNGNPITTLKDIQNSDLSRIYDITETGVDGNTFILKFKSTIPTAIEKISNSGIYELSNVKYEIGNELSCLTYDDNVEYDGLILKNEDNKYLMSFKENKDMNILNCMIKNKYNDLSNYVKCEYKDSNCPTKITNNALYVLGFSNNAYTFHCGKDGIISEYKSDTITIQSSPTAVTITFPAADPSLPSQGSVCHFLYSFKRDVVKLESSDVKSTNMIGYDIVKYNYHKEEEKPNINTKPQPVENEKIDIIGEIGEIGANLQCKDKISNKFLGLAILLGKDEENKYIMKYLFDTPKDSDSYICEVNEVINDLSLIKSEEIVEDDCPNKELCMIVISGILNILKLSGFYNTGEYEDNINNRMLLLENEYEASCVNAKNEVKKYLVIPEDMGGEDAIFSISENDMNDELPIGMECRLLASAIGNKVSLEESQFGQRLYFDESGTTAKTTPCTPSADGICDDGIDKTTIVIGETLLNAIKAEQTKSGKFFIPLKTENRTIIENYLQAGKWIDIGGTIVQILNVDYTLVDAPTLPRRELRELATGSVKGYYLTLDKEIKISLSGEIIIKLNANSNSYDIHKKLECSGQGVCNRESGLCECFSGYSGDSCQRLDCPNNCNGNGRCVSLSELLSNSELKEYKGFGNIYKTNEMIFDDKIYGCLCDKRHRGYDCSLIECPSGEDPEGGSNIDGNDDEKRDCSGRGICNYVSGVCECFERFSGEGCQTMIETI